VSRGSPRRRQGRVCLPPPSRDLWHDRRRTQRPTHPLLVAASVLLGGCFGDAGYSVTAGRRVQCLPRRHRSISEGTHHEVRADDFDSGEARRVVSWICHLLGLIE
jgi:hypothetical protein